jgi:hypothetical protein
MSTTEARTEADDRPFWQAEPFWNRLNRVESHHLQVQVRHEAVRRELASVQSSRQAEFLDAWRRYCAVIEELDTTTAELEFLRTRPGALEPGADPA